MDRQTPFGPIRSCEAFSDSSRLEAALLMQVHCTAMLTIKVGALSLDQFLVFTTFLFPALSFCPLVLEAVSVLLASLLDRHAPAARTNPQLHQWPTLAYPLATS
jgi:hypothetical protein